MSVFEFQAYGNTAQFNAIDEAIRTMQFVRNNCLRLGRDGNAKSCFDLNKYTKVLAIEFDFAYQLHSMARQSATEGKWAAISRFYDNCKKNIPGKKGLPKLQKDCRSVEYKTSGGNLCTNRKSITFTDKHGIGRLKLKGTRDLHFYQLNQIKRVRLVKRADGYYVQFCIKVDRTEVIEPSHPTIGLDVGLESFYTDSEGHKVENPRFSRTSEIWRVLSEGKRQ